MGDLTLDAMTNPVPATHAPLTRIQWVVLILLALSVFINYIDRTNLSVAAPLLKVELSLSPEQLGFLLSIFFYTYAGFQLFGIAGYFVERFNVYWVFAVGYLLWTLATAVTGMVSGFGMLVMLRLILGMGESIAYPAYSRILASDFPEHHRGLANALIDAGSKSGPALGTLLGGLLVARFGWRAFFVALGLGGLLWLIPWLMVRPKGPATSVVHVHEGGPSVWDIMKLPVAWGTFGGLFCANYFWYFLLTWLPSYLVMDRKMSMETMATVGSLAYFAIGFTTTISGWFADRLIRRGATPTRVRRAFAATGLSLATIILPVGIIKDLTTSMALLLIACGCFGIFTCSHWAITQTLAGPRAAGKWTGIQNGIGNLAGVVSPWLAGFIVQRTGSFFLAFAAAAAIAFTGACMFIFVIRKVEPVDWDRILARSQPS